MICERCGESAGVETRESPKFASARDLCKYCWEVESNFPPVWDWKVFDWMHRQPRPQANA